MTIPMNAPEILDREFLEVRARLLEVAASLDRIDRADGAVEQDPRVAKLLSALDVLRSPKPGRAEQLQIIFSQNYQDDWRQSYGL